MVNANVNAATSRQVDTIDEPIHGHHPKSYQFSIELVSQETETEADQDDADNSGDQAGSDA